MARFIPMLQRSLLGVKGPVAYAITTSARNIVNSKLSLVNIIVNKRRRATALASMVLQPQDSVPDLLARSTVGGLLQEGANVAGTGNMLAVGEVVAGVNAVDIVGDEVGDFVEKAFLVAADGASVTVDSLGSG